MSTDKKVIVILGITGQQGGSVAKIFQSEPGWHIRGVTRNPDKPSNGSLREAGIELVAGDLDDVPSLEAAFEGADAIFSVTDFWQFVKPDSPAFPLAQKQNRQPNEVAYEMEVQQGKNIMDAAAKAHAKKPLHRLVISTLADSKKWSNGEIKHNLHFDGKAHYCQYLKETYPSLAKVSSYVQVGYYLSNGISFPFWSPHKDPTTGEWIVPMGGKAGGNPVPFVNPPNDVGYFVRALIGCKPETVMLGYCQHMRAEEYVELWGKTMSVKARIEFVGYEYIKAAGMPDWMALEAADSGRFNSVWGWDGGEPGVKGPEECGVDMGKLTNVADWIRGQDWGVIGR